MNSSKAWAAAVLVAGGLAMSPASPASANTPPGADIAFQHTGLPWRVKPELSSQPTHATLAPATFAIAWQGGDADDDPCATRRWG